MEGDPADSDWREWCAKKNIDDGTDAEVATSFWRRYEEDFTLAKELGVNAFRLSIAWERIQPRPHEFDFEW